NATVGLARALLLSGDTEACATLLAYTYIAGKQFISAIPLRNVFTESGSRRDPRNIAWPILRFVSHSERRGQREARHIYVALDEFLESYRMDRPSDLASHL